jgi:preprotein translocase subunit SecE
LGEEWQKVTWPTPTQLLGQTLVVMLVVGLMTLFIWGVDSLWRWGITAITP